MTPFTFQTTPNVLFEAGAAQKVAGLVADVGARRVLFVTDKGVRGAGLTRAAEASLAEAAELTVFEDVVADPPAQVVEAAVALAQEKQVEAVVSIGGGSALDTAKLVAYLARSDDRLDDIFRSLVGQSPVRSRVAQAGPDDPAPKTMAAFTLKRSTMGASSCSYDRCQSVAVTQVDPAADPKTVSTFRASASTKKGV